MARVERAVRRERADVQLVDDAAGELASRPAAVGPREGRRVDDGGEAVHAVGLRGATGDRAGRARRRRAAKPYRVPAARSTSARHQPPSAAAIGTLPPPVTSSHAPGERRPHGRDHDRRLPERGGRRGSGRGCRRRPVVPPGSGRPVNTSVTGWAARTISRVLPPAARCQPHRQPRRQRDGATPVEGEQVLGGRAVGLDGQVAVEQLGPVASQAQRPAGDQQLGRAGLVDRWQQATIELVEEVAAALEVDRPPVVGVDEGRLPQLAALVHVGHAGRRQLDELGRQRVAPSRLPHPVQQRLQHGGHPLVVVHGVDQLVEGRLEAVRRCRPARRVTRLAGGLLGVGVQPLPLDRPGTDGGLPHQLLERPVAQWRQLVEALQRRRPLAGDLGQRRDARPHVLAALGVVGGQRRQRLREAGQAGLLALVELGDREGELVGVAAHLGERAEAVEAVEGGVLDALGHHHPRRLLEADRRRVGRVAEHREQVVHRGGEVGPVADRRGGRGVEVLVALGQVRAVHREAGEQLGDGVGARPARRRARSRSTSERRMPSATSRLVSWISVGPRTGGVRRAGGRRRRPTASAARGSTRTRSMSASTS